MGNSQHTDGSAEPDLERFREHVRSFLGARFRLREVDADDDRGDVIARAPDGHQVLHERALEFHRALAAAGFRGVDLATAYGGRGLRRIHAAMVEEELRRYDTPSLRPLGIGMTLGLHTLLAAGSEQQKQRYLPPLVRGDEQWCQLFSEPDAGSDLASLRTRAVFRDGDWVVSGQKVWSSYATRAHFGLLLARTDPDADRPQAGITMFILPMDAPGVTGRPLVDIAGGEHFCEVFLDDVRLSPDQMLGSLNDGWRVSQGTLGGERSGYMGGSGGRRRERQVLVAMRDSGLTQDGSARQVFARVVAAERTLEWLRDRFQRGRLADGSPVAGSLLKVAAGTLEQQTAEAVMGLRGISGVAWSGSDRDGNVAAHELCTSRQARIAGGTHEIQRNLLAERLLGLPREPR